MKPDSTKSIFRSANHFLGGTLISRFTGMCRDIAIAFAFGTESTLAAFMVAFRFAHLMRRLLGEGAMQTAFIPHFEELRDDHPLRACQFFSNLYGALTLLLILLIPLGMTFLGILYFYGNMSPGNREIVLLTLIMLPSLLFICLYGLNSALLQCEKNYFTPSAAPAIFNLIWIAGVFALKSYTAEQAMPWLAACIIAAAFGQWTLTIPPTLRALRSHGHGTPWKGINLRENDLLALGKPLFLGLFGIAASQFNNFLDSIFSRYASAEGPAYLWYSVRAQQLPLALFGVAIAGALLPPLTRAIKVGDFLKFRHFLDASLRRTLAIMLPISIGIFVIGDSAINLIYGRGEFSIESTVQTSVCLWAYSIGLLPMALVLILAPAFYAQKNYTIPTFAAIATMILNVILNSWMVMGLGLGAVSVALATSVSAWLNFFILFFVLSERVKEINASPYLGRAFRTLLASLIGCLAVVTVETFLFGGSTAADILHGETPDYPRVFSQQYLRFFTEAATYLISTYLGAWICRATDVLRLVHSSSGNRS